MVITDTHTRRQLAPLMCHTSPSASQPPIHRGAFEAFQEHFQAFPPDEGDDYEQWKSRAQHTFAILKKHVAGLSDDAIVVNDGGVGALRASDLKRVIANNLTGWLGESLVQEYASLAVASTSAKVGPNGKNTRITYLDGRSLQAHMGVLGGCDGDSSQTLHYKRLRTFLHGAPPAVWISVTCVNAHFRANFVHHHEDGKVVAHFSDGYATCTTSLFNYQHALMHGVESVLKHHGVSYTEVVVKAIPRAELRDKAPFGPFGTLTWSDLYTCAPAQKDGHTCGARALMVVEAMLRGVDMHELDRWQEPTYKLLMCWSLFLLSTTPPNTPPHHIVFNIPTRAYMVPFKRKDFNAGRRLIDLATP